MTAQLHTTYLIQLALDLYDAARWLPGGHLFGERYQGTCIGIVYRRAHELVEAGADPADVRRIVEHGMAAGGVR